MKRRDPSTGDLFATIPTPAPAVAAGLDFRSRVARITCDMFTAAQARDPGLDRFGIAASVSRFAGKDVSKATLDSYTAESRDGYNLPLWLAPAMEVACHSTALTAWLCEVRGGRLILGPDALDAEIGRIEHQREIANERLRELRDLRRKVRHG